MGLKAVAIGLPKTGTTTLHEALESAGLHSVHRIEPGDGRMPTGYQMLRNHLRGAPIMAGLEHVEAVTQLDTCRRGFNVWPQMCFGFLRQLHAEHPDCAFMLQTRAPAATLRSIERHGDLRERIVWAPGLFGDKTTDADLISWPLWHYTNVRGFFELMDMPLTTFDIADPRAPQHIEAAIGRPLKWWGRSNAR